MKPILVLFAVASAAAAGYLAGDSGRVGIAPGIVGGLALFALLIAWVVPSGGASKPVALRPAAPPEAARDRRVLRPADMARLREQERLLASGNPVAVRLARVGQNQIAVIKVLRTYLDLGLKEAKDFTDTAKKGGLPLLVAEMAAERARAFAHDVEEAGGVLEFEEPAAAR